MENMKTAVSFSEVAKQEEIQEIEKKCEQDVLSLRRIMKGKYQQLCRIVPSKDCLILGVIMRDVMWKSIL